MSARHTVILLVSASAGIDLRRRLPALAALLLGICLPLLGCADSDRAGDAPDAGLALREVSRIGALDGEAALGRVADVALHEDVVFVLEAQSPRVLRFDRDGTLLGSFAGEGDGPGELSRPWGIGLTGGDLWIADPSGGRLEVYTPEGEHIRSIRFRVPADSLGSESVPSALLAGGELLVAPSPLSVGPVLSGDLEHQTYYRSRPDGTVLDPLYEGPVPATDFFRATLEGGRGPMGGHPHPERPLAAPFPDGSGMAVVERFEASTADSASFRLLVFDPGGDRETDRTIHYAPRSAEGWREAFADETETSLAERGMPEPRRRAFLDAILDALAERSFYPPVTGIVPGHDSTVWLRREGLGDTVSWEIYARSGERLGELDLPAEVGLHAVSRDEAWGVVRDSLDVPYVVGYEVVR